MNRNASQPPSLTTTKQLNLVLPAVTVGGLVFFALIVNGLFFKPSTQAGKTSLIVGAAGLLYMIFISIWGVPLLRNRPYYGWLLAVASGVGVGIIDVYEPALIIGTTLPLSLTIIVILAVLSGRWPTYLFTFLVMASNIFSFLLVPVDQTSLFFLEAILIPVIAVVITETILGLRNSLLVEMKRLQTLNRVARSLASSLEMHQVVTLVSSAIQNAFAADTYYVGLLQGETFQMELFFDDGEFFPTMNIALKDTLAGRVVESRHSLLIRDLVSERKKRNLPFIIVGRPRMSSSWMGTPLMINGHIAGIIGVASYQKNVFDEGDLELLENIAQQAALALDNAEHHAEVETRSQHDSLTGVLNHNAFLARFERQAREAVGLKNPLSLIMLDIDHFKLYNDRFGHLTGDEVLTNLCQVIRRNVKKTDLIGRWGGEEFVISLPHANGPQAFRVAERIRTTLENLAIKGRAGQLIPSPTISQGIAVLVDETLDFIQLVDLADQRLYIAKDLGGNKIEPSLRALEENQPLAESEGTEA
jgi:diguanylate cyclase (GGDEF)-like protein